MEDLAEIMFEFNVLILTSLTLFIVSLSILFYLVATKSKQLDRLKQVLHGRIKKIRAPHHVCSHHFGYLASYPRDRPIPDECMGCSEIFECFEYKKPKPTPIEKVQGIAYLKVRFVLGLVTLLIGILAANLALFHLVERTGLYYARYVCAFGGFAAMIFGAMLINDFLVLRKVLKGEYVEYMPQCAAAQEKKKKVVDRGRKNRRQTIAVASLAILLFMLYPILASSLVSYTATTVITYSPAWLYVNSDDESRNISVTRVGANPYLDAIDYNTSYLEIIGDNIEAGNFGFTDSGKSTETIDNVTVQLYAKQSRGGDNLEVFLWNGSLWTSLGLKEIPTSWSWVNWTATTQLNSWAKIDAAKIYFATRTEPGATTFLADCARLQVDYS